MQVQDPLVQSHMKFVRSESPSCLEAATGSREGVRRCEAVEVGGRVVCACSRAVMCNEFYIFHFAGLGERCCCVLLVLVAGVVVAVVVDLRL